MKKEKDTALKNLLNLKEDYILDLDKYKDSENLSFKEDEKDNDGTSEEKDEDGTADEEDADESSEETDDDETAEESEEDEDPNNRRITDDGKNDEGKKEPKKPVSKYLKVEGLPEIFDAMKKAESAADVGQSLKKFLSMVRQSSVEALVKTENQNKEENQNEEPAEDPKKEK